MLAFSSCWNNSRHTCGEEMITEIVELGFQNIELSHGMTIAKLPGIRKAYAAGMFTCSGVHNYFPSPVEVMIDAPDAYEYTSHRPFDRTRAMEMTLKTLELAAEFKAQYLVLHMGSAPMNTAKFTKPLTKLVATGEQRDPAFVKKKIAFIKKREKLAPLYYQRAIEALEELAPKAEEYGVKLAVESRSRFEDMPNEREMVKLQEHFKDNPWIGYWHDFGHVQLKHNLGVLDHMEWLETISPHLIGGHVHDVQWPARDHRTPFTGTLDYDSILPFFPKNCPLIWELSPTREASEIREALGVWKAKFPERS
ncbi:MAG: sugar phosphate isomerase/epimerase [Akkermansiaceae bacterium]|jgi:sugar phosphate isomerase/epimerase|nr:sugar phosphate isomerase/epimerase [Akkermansiaceae bacterium]MDP4645765.1 sugar phosphate isomerase/epimerase [Akkermansiaceae bacterium]MDP4720068.1 sugar phosphate isomerase/epimerase [Akkermansiaceae bacterium]MDP4781522.1 sugar phosphate isomerase/epimerase [Akkermansiaceae bacterium]MDP4847695.1 sugar phosphate isomerase/epimerase [Akkermansiaceae bacterium]